MNGGLNVDGVNDHVTARPQSGIARRSGRVGAMVTTALYNFFTGTLDEVRVYDRALSASEVSQLYTNPAGAVI